MKTIFSLVLLTMFAASTLAQVCDKKGLGHSYKRQGVELFILSEPACPYEVTGRVVADDWDSFKTSMRGEEDKRTLTEKIDVLINNATRKARKKKFQFDAIITEDGSTGTCIKFK